MPSNQQMQGYFKPVPSGKPLAKLPLHYNMTRYNSILENIEGINGIQIDKQYDGDGSGWKIGLSGYVGNIPSGFPYREQDPWAVIIDDDVPNMTIKNAGLFGIDAEWREVATDLVVTAAGFVYGKLLESPSDTWTLTTHFTVTESETESTASELEAGTVKVKAFQVVLTDQGGATGDVLRISRDWIHSGVWLDRAGWEEKATVTFTQDCKLTSTSRVLSSTNDAVLDDEEYIAGDVGKVLGIVTGTPPTLELITAGGGGSADFDAVAGFTSVSIVSTNLVIVMSTKNTITGAAGTAVNITIPVASFAD